MQKAEEVVAKCAAGCHEDGEKQHHHNHISHLATNYGRSGVT